MKFISCFLVIIVSLLTCFGQKDIVFILDRSSEVSEVDFQDGIDFIHSVVSYLDIGPEHNLISVITYAETVTEVMDLKAYQTKPELMAAIKGIRHVIDKGSRDTHKSLAYAREHSYLPSHGGREGKGKAAVLITHGVSYVPFAIRESSSLKNLGVELFTIGIGSAAVDGLEEMQAVSSDPDSKYVYTLLSFSELKTIAKEVAEKLKEVPVVSTPAPIKHLDISIVVMIVVASLFFLIVTVVMVYACLYQRHRRQILAITKGSKCGNCNPSTETKSPIQTYKGNKETDNSSLPNSLTDSTDDTGYIGSDQPRDVVTDTRMTAGRKPSRPKIRRSRAVVRPSLNSVSPRAVDFRELLDVPTDKRNTVVITEMPKRTETVDRQEKFVTNRKSQIKVRKSSVAARNKTPPKIDVPWCDSFAYPPQGSSLRVPSSGRGAVFLVIPPS